MSMSGWWSAAFAASATRFTKAIDPRKSGKTFVRRIIPPSSAHPGWAFSHLCTSESLSFVRSRAMTGSLRPFHGPLPLRQGVGPCSGFHLRLEGLPCSPGSVNLLGVAPHAHPDAGQEGSTCGGGLEVPRSHHRATQDVRLVLHQEVVRAR